MDQTSSASRNILIVTGEASGDLHGAGLVRAMQKIDSGLFFSGMGGKELRQAGVEILFDIEKIAVMGLAEILTHLRDIFRALRCLKQEIKQKKPALVILIDFADFNFRIAKEAKKNGIPVFYYITPKVWVWRKRRVKTLAKLVDKAGVILPFEENYLQSRGVNATYTGNPIVDEVAVKFNRSDFCQKYGIDSNKAIVGILPGSRRKEVSLLLPVFLEAAKRMQQKYAKELVFLIPLASTLSENDLDNAGLSKYREDLDIIVVSEDRYELMSSCEAAVAASGTVTLELALLDIPMVVAYRFSLLTYLIGKILIHIPFFSLVNIIADKEIVTELLQDQVNPANIELELAQLIFDDTRRLNLQRELAGVRLLLGGKGASEKAAGLAFDTMKQ